MSRYKLSKLALLIGVAVIPAVNLTGCVTVKNTWQGLFGIDKSTRESTGYYEYENAKLADNTIVVPEGLEDPGFNKSLFVPKVDPNKLQGAVGDKVDIRPPVTPLRSDIGIHSQYLSGEAFVWFEPNGEHGIRSEDDAWMLLAAALKRANIGVGKLVDGEYLLTTISRDYNLYGRPYDASDEEQGALKYTQVYQCRVGRNNFGELGIGSKMIASMTSLSNGKQMEDSLDAIEQERFAMGFTNNIIHELGISENVNVADPENLVISLDRDSNNHVAIMVEAPFETTMSLLNAALPAMKWKVVKYSVAKAEYEIEIQEMTDAFYRRSGLPRPPNMPVANYKIRVGIEGSRCSISFYNSDDNPLTTEVADLYPIVSAALANAFRDHVAASEHFVRAK